MSKIEIGRYSELLRRQLGMKGVTEVAGELSPEISPTFVLEGPGAEWDFLKAVRGCRCADEQLGAVGFASVFRLRNPVGSGVIAVVDAVAVTPEGTVQIGVARGQIFGELANLLVTVVPDLRWGAVGATTTTLIFSSAAAGGGPGGDVIARARPLGLTEWLYREPIVLMPGTNLDWGMGFGSTNENVHGWAAWRERQLPALET